ncbi:phage holin family protein [Candidatus Saccharibacteria bacterium]|nr:phage holin family protein [Candidatus Saccharibacteria bacterium]MDQ5958746.1 putative rane protein [Patescibacteria group bacterium]
MKKQAFGFLLRWSGNTISLWAASLAGIVTLNGNILKFLIAGLLLALLNSLIKPLLVIFTLPLITYTMGLFLIIINGVIMVVLSWLYGPLSINSFWQALLAGTIVGLLNYIISFGLDKKDNIVERRTV